MFPIAVFILWLISFTVSVSPSTPSFEIVYGNPRVYNVRFSFEIIPDPVKIDREKDLKVWIPVPREWSSQKGVKIIKVTPAPHSQGEDPEHGNQMLFWDFGQEPSQESYTVNIEFRLESYEIHANIDPEKVGTYDETTEKYRFYTKSSPTILITPKIRQLALEAVGNETNPFLKAKRIYLFAKTRMRFRFLDAEKGRGIESLLNNPIIDPDSRIEYYEGGANQYTVFFVALCRAIGIPARSVQGTIGFDPSVKEEDLKPIYEIKLSPTGLGGAQHFGSETWHGPVIRPITWAEFYIPNYGWIPADLTHEFCHLDNWRIILSKGTDILIVPDAPKSSDQGYGTQWVLLNQGRTDLFREPVWNISKIHKANIKATHFSDPFPADAYTYYSSADNFITMSQRKKILMWTYTASKCNENLHFIYREAFLCHLLRRIVGDDRFTKIFNEYHDLLLSSHRPVPTTKFQEIAENVYGSSLDHFFKQWVECIVLPQFKLDSVAIEKHADGWSVSGKLLQIGETWFRTLIELAIETEKGMNIKELWLDSKNTYFKFHVFQKPTKLIVDPNFHIQCIRQMPAHLLMFWNFYPNLVIIYGTSKEANANRTAAEKFNDEELGLGHEVIKADTIATEEDLKKDIVILFGRPETNKLTKQFEYAFPIQFEENQFSWRGITYKKPSQGVMQIIESPINPTGWIILYAGLSNEATLKMSDIARYDADASYIIFSGNNVFVSDDWELKGDLIWCFEAQDELKR